MEAVPSCHCPYPIHTSIYYLIFTVCENYTLTGYISSENVVLRPISEEVLYFGSAFLYYQAMERLVIKWISGHTSNMLRR